MTDTITDTHEETERARNLPAVLAAEALVARGEVTVQEVVAQRDKIEQVMHAVMKEGVHYGKVPGVSKPTLLKPGAEVLSTTFRFAPYYASERTFHDGGHLTVVTKVTLRHIPTGMVVAEGEGLCTTYEKKYAYRSEGRVCPSCGAAAIRRSKFPPRESDYPGASTNDPPGWYCHKGAGGCGANYAAADDAITGQEGGRVANPDLPDTWNTALKMANKRALVAAILNGTAASDIFTQDVEDGPTGAGSSPPSPPKPSYRDEHPGYAWPNSLTEITERMGRALGDEEDAKEWMREVFSAMFPAVEFADLTAAEKNEAGIVCSRALFEIEGAQGDLAFDPGVRKFVQDVFAPLLGGVVLEGPPWRVSASEGALPTREEYQRDLAEAETFAEQAADAADAEPDPDEDIPFGEESPTAEEAK